MANLSAISMLAEVDGLVLVDKPAGMAAHDLERAVKARFNLVKTAHGAMLDPGASGVFVLILGDATRRTAELMAADGTYEGEMTLGLVTDTCDSRGRTLATHDGSTITREAVESAAAGFRGDIYQTPPAFSAVRIQGRPDWEIVPNARDTAERLVHVYRLAVSDVTPPSVRFTLSCTRGVSVRRLAHDWGQSLGCGAALTGLRRTKVGAFSLDDAIPLMDLLKLDPVSFKQRVLPAFGALRP